MSFWDYATPLLAGGDKPLGDKPFGDQSSSYANNLYLLGQNQLQDKTAIPTGQQNVTSASSNLSQAANYESGILSGNRDTVLATEAPEISSLLSSYDSARKASAQLAPRGGGRSSYLNELPYKEAGDVNSLIQKARPEAAKALTQTANAQALLGESEQSLAGSDINSSLNFLLGKAGVQLNTQQLQGQQGQAAGQAAAQLLMLAAAA